MSFLTEYGLFLAKAATIIIAIILVVAAIAAIIDKSKSKGKQKGKLIIKKISDKFDEFTSIIEEASLSKAQLKQQKKEKKPSKSKRNKKSKGKSSEEKPKPRIFVLKFQGDIRASATNALREEVTAILLTVKSHDEVLLCLESQGGMVNAYGFAASQLQRLRDANIKLTIAIDKVAASGGYMMACVADQIIAAPFAVIGSIGVIAQLPNFNKFLHKRNIDFEQVTAGEYKRTISLFGENTKTGRAKLQNEIDEIHELFKGFIKTHREEIDLAKVATGEHWYASKALEYHLVDTLKTSDDFIIEAQNKFDIYQIQYKIKKPFGKKIAENAHVLLTRMLHSSNYGGQDYL